MPPGNEERQARIYEAVRALRDGGIARPSATHVRGWLLETYPADRVGDQNALNEMKKRALAEILKEEDASAPALPFPEEMEARFAGLARNVWRDAAARADAAFELKRLETDERLAEAEKTVAAAENFLAAAEAERDERAARLAEVERALEAERETRRAAEAALERALAAQAAAERAAERAEARAPAAEEGRDGARLAALEEIVADIARRIPVPAPGRHGHARENPV